MDLPEPRVSEDEVLIQVKAASINPIDFKVRQGKLKAVLAYSFPLILGHDCAGVVAKTGAAVKRFRIGDEVYTRPDRIGTLAEFVAAREQHVAKMPKNTSFEEAASLPLVGLTSWQALLQRAGMKNENRVFVPAGSGGVGSLAIQLAKHFGAYVITNCSTKNLGFVRSLGADEVIDYTKQDFSRVISDIDIVFDTVGGETQKKAFRILRSGGTLVSISGPPTAQSMREANRGSVLQLAASLLSLRVSIRSYLTRTHYIFFLMLPDGETLEKIGALVEGGSIRPVIDRTFPFDKANEAVEYVEAGHARGKVIVTSCAPP
ncbi:MAG TPA: NADP-dependent oxidoreductase [Micropepsaceae bacterium]|nr:NADP-dependent oxidoreductase [Micropepsaceae bacterium]